MLNTLPATFSQPPFQSTLIRVAALTVLYPDEFTIYDIRVYGVLGDFEWVQNKPRYDELWDGYSKYITAIGKATPAELSLRDKDRCLWGKSFYEQLQHDIERKFTSDKAGDETEA